MNSEIGEKVCSECDGDGGMGMGDYPYSDTCPKCKGKGTLDWIENIVGVDGTYIKIKPGVYIKEVDYSEYITEPGVFKRDSLDDPWRFEREYIGDKNGE